MTTDTPAAQLRDRIRRAICEASGFTWLPDELMEPDEYGEHADAVLAVLPELPVRQVLGTTTSTGDTEVVAYQDSNNPHMLFCRTHGERWAGLSPLTSQDLPHGGICTLGHASGDKCGRNVLPATKERQ